LGITTGPDNNIWYDDVGLGAIGRITPSGTISVMDVSPAAIPTGITVGADNNLWFTDSGLNGIGIVRLDGIFKDRFEPAM
jgi:virginiamycin B lyase